jgi:hypothetical protein
MLDNEHGYSYAPFSQWDRPFKQKRECPIGCLLGGCRIRREEEIIGEPKQMASTGQDTRRNEEAQGLLPLV